jgi:hypothetical protein
MTKTAVTVFLCYWISIRGLASEDRHDPKQPPQKHGYSVLNPVPKALLRELSSDRPDQTESAYTVDAGHFQVEMDIVTYTRDHYERDRTDILETGFVAPNLNFKVGLLNRMDVQLVFPIYNRVRLEERSLDSREVFRDSGPGDVQVRTKMNLWGNDGGSTAMSIMPFIQLPSGTGSFTSGGVEGGLIFPFAFRLPKGFECGMMHEIDFLRGDSVSGNHREFIQSIALGRDIHGRFSGYVEFFSAVSSDRSSDWVGTVDCGINWLIHDNFKLDAGVNIGATRAASDFNPFLGLTWRF